MNQKLRFEQVVTEWRRHSIVGAAVSMVTRKMLEAGATVDTMTITFRRHKYGLIVEANATQLTPPKLEPELDKGAT